MPISQAHILESPAYPSLQRYMVGQHVPFSCVRYDDKKKYTTTSMKAMVILDSCELELIR